MRGTFGRDRGGVAGAARRRQGGRRADGHEQRLLSVQALHGHRGVREGARPAADLYAQLRTWDAADISANGLYDGDLERALRAIEARVPITLFGGGRETRYLVKQRMPVRYWQLLFAACLTRKFFTQKWPKTRVFRKKSENSHFSKKPVFFIKNVKILVFFLKN